MNDDKVNYIHQMIIKELSPDQIIELRDKLIVGIPPKYPIITESVGMNKDWKTATDEDGGSVTYNEAFWKKWNEMGKIDKTKRDENTNPTDH